MTIEFEIATENLYNTFSKYPFNSTIEGCPCCVSNSDKSTLHSKKLRDLDDADLSRYAFKAMTTWGDVNNYKHYLPRIFELTAQRKLIVDTFVTLGKLDYAKWKEWETGEQERVNEFLKAWWKYDINYASSFDVEILVEIHRLILDIKSMLSMWDVGIENQGFINYVEFVEYHYHELVGKNKTFNSLADQEVEVLKEWVKSNKDKLEEGFFMFEGVDKKFSERISTCLYMLERID